MLALGITIIILGLLLVSSSYQSETKPKVTSVLVSKVEKQWSVSGNMQINDKMVVELRTGTDWAIGALYYDEPGAQGISVLFVFLEINHLGNSTKYEIMFARNSQGQLNYWNISVTEHNGLNVTSLYDSQAGTYEGIGGIVEYDGLYNVTVTELLPDRQEPPSYLGIFKGKIETVTAYPYASFLSWGVALGVVGAVASVVGLRNPKRRRIQVKKKESRISRRVTR